MTSDFSQWLDGKQDVQAIAPTGEGSQFNDWLGDVKVPPPPPTFTERAGDVLSNLMPSKIAANLGADALAGGQDEHRIKPETLEAAPLLGLHSGAWLLGETAGVAQTALGGINRGMLSIGLDNAIKAKDADKIIKYSNLLEGRYSAKTVREQADIAREAAGMMVPQPRTEGGKDALDAVGAGFEKMLFWTEHVKSAFDAMGMPEIGPIVTFGLEMYAFKMAHVVGSKPLNKAMKREAIVQQRAYRKMEREIKNADPQKAREIASKALEDSGLTSIAADIIQGLESAKTPAERQAIIHRVWKEYVDTDIRKKYGDAVANELLVENVSGTATPQARQALIDRQMGGEIADAARRPEPVPPAPEPIVEPPRQVVSGEKPTAQTNLEARQHLQDVQNLQQSIPPRSALDRPDLPPEARRIMEAAQEAQRRKAAETPAETAPKPQPAEAPPASQPAATEIPRSVEAKPSVPEFARTQDAHAYGREATPEQVKALREAETQARARSAELREEAKTISDPNAMLEKMNEGMNEATRAQFFREAVEASEGKHPIDKPLFQKLNKGEEAPPSVQKMNIEDVKATKDAPTKIDLDRLPDWVEKALEDFYNEPKGKTRMHEVAKQLLTDGELKTPGLVKSFKQWYKKQNDVFESATKIAEAEAAPVPKVDPEIGRAPGGHTAPKKQSSGMSDLEMQVKIEAEPILRPDGTIAKTASAAKRYGDQQGRVGEVVKNPNGEGWLIKATPAQRRKMAKREQAMWDKILESEGLAPEPTTRSTMRDLMDIFGDQTGSVTFETGPVKELKNLIRGGRISEKQVISSLRKGGATEAQISKFVSDLHTQMVEKAAAGKKVESKWLQEGQDPAELLARRRRNNGHDAPAVSRSEAHVASTVKDMSIRWVAEHLGIENPIRTFEKLGSGIKDIFYEKYKAHETAMIKETKLLLREVKGLASTVNHASRERIMSYAIAKQADGVAVLKQQGSKVVTELTPREMKVYERLREHYKSLYDRLNEARVASGEGKFPAVDNYFTWATDFARAQKEIGANFFEDFRSIQSRQAESPITTSDRFTKHRADADKPRRIVMDPFDAFQRYTRESLQYIHTAPHLAKLHELLGDKFGMKTTAPNAHRFLSEWRDALAGKRPAWDATNSKFRRGVDQLHSNVVWGLLAYNVRSALIQPSALTGTYAIAGEFHTTKGLINAMRPAAVKMAWETSNVLHTRAPYGPDVSLAAASTSKLGKAGSVVQKVAVTGTQPLAWLDHYTATASWLSFYSQAKGMKHLKTHEARVKYADNMTTKTQASASKADIAPIQRASLGKYITGLQTFVINQWGMITKDIMGIRNADPHNPKHMARAMRFVLGVTLMNHFYEDVLGVNSPFPTPIRALREKHEELSKKNKGNLSADDYINVGRVAAKEVAELVPIWGGSIRFGSSIGGPVVSTLMDLADEDKDYKATLGKLAGIPGSSQISKSYRAAEKNGTMLDIILGRYVEDEEPSAFGLGLGSGSFGLDD